MHWENLLLQLLVLLFEYNADGIMKFFSLEKRWYIVHFYENLKLGCRTPKSNNTAASLSSDQKLLFIAYKDKQQ